MSKGKNSRLRKKNWSALDGSYGLTIWCISIWEKGERERTRIFFICLFNSFMSPQFDVIFHVTHFVIFADVNKNIFETPSSFLVQFIEKNIFRDQTHLNTQIEGIYLLVQWCRKVWKLYMPPKEDFHKLVGAVIADWPERNFRVIGLKVIQDWPELQIDLKFAFNYKYNTHKFLKCTF